MKTTRARILFWFLFLSLASFALLILLAWDDTLAGRVLFHFQQVRDNSVRIRAAIREYGNLGPLVFMGLQILQVIFAPVPGEATGILGGYLFGALPGFLYSSLALTIGSGLAYLMGRLLGNAFHDRITSTRLYVRFNKLVVSNDCMVPFILFLLPGFPKDSLSYLLGMSIMPLRVFIFIAGVARLPGTLVLSLQGDQFYRENYLGLLLMVLFSLAISLPCFYYRKKILKYLLKSQKKSAQK
ncbi:MAG: VTT domain-containing protein [Desulfobacterales bacterium]|nr:VTT domain-containing protein [Desulfobacterales bacterium]